MYEARYSCRVMWLLFMLNSNRLMKKLCSVCLMHRQVISEWIRRELCSAHIRAHSHLRNKQSLNLPT